MTWLATDTFYSFDTETTDADPRSARVLSAGLVRLQQGSVGRSEEWLMNPGVDISEESIAIHGLTNEHVQAHGVDPKVALEEVITYLAKILNSGAALVVYNAPYDLTVLELEARRYGLTPLTERVASDAFKQILDPFVLAKGALHNVLREYTKGQKYTLPAMCERFGVDFEETHSAAADSLGAALLMRQLIAEIEVFHSFAPARFWLYQRNWRTNQQNSLREHFEATGVDHDGVDGSWPFYEAALISA